MVLLMLLIYLLTFFSTVSSLSLVWIEETELSVAPELLSGFLLDFVLVFDLALDFFFDFLEAFLGLFFFLG